jgi:hypothetical protein
MGRSAQHAEGQSACTKRGRKSTHNWPEHLAIWLDDVARNDPERLHGSMNKIAERAMGHLVKTMGSVPADAKHVRDMIVEWMKAHG